MYFYPGKTKTYARAYNKARAARFAALQLVLPGFSPSENAPSVGYSNTHTLCPMGQSSGKSPDRNTGNSNTHTFSPMGETKQTKRARF